MKFLNVATSLVLLANLMPTTEAQQCSGGNRNISPGPFEIKENNVVISQRLGGSNCPCSYVSIQVRDIMHEHILLHFYRTIE